MHDTRTLLSPAELLAWLGPLDGHRAPLDCCHGQLQWSVGPEAGAFWIDTQHANGCRGPHDLNRYPVVSAGIVWRLDWQGESRWGPLMRYLVTAGRP
jgi:hypothetical protein